MGRLAGGNPNKKDIPLNPSRSGRRHKGCQSRLNRAGQTQTHRRRQGLTPAGALGYFRPSDPIRVDTDAVDRTHDRHGTYSGSTLLVIGPFLPPQVSSIFRSSVALSIVAVKSVDSASMYLSGTCSTSSVALGLVMATTTTRCSPGTQPSPSWNVVKVKRPWASVCPRAGRVPAGMNCSEASATGSPSISTCPETGTTLGPLRQQPGANQQKLQSQNRNRTRFMVMCVTSSSVRAPHTVGSQ